MDRLVDEGLIVVGGPLGAGDRTAHLIEGADPCQIRAWLAAEPRAKDNHLAVGSLEPWALWLDGRSSATKGADPDCARSSDST
jgi:hypothetical protein